MSAFYIRYPASSGGSSSNPANGSNGTTAPTISTQVGGVGADGNLHPISTDNSGNVNVNIISGGGSSSITYLTSVRLDYSVTNVDDTTWTQLIANTGATDSKQVTVFDSGGYAMELGVGAVASEVRNLLVPPGGLNGEISLVIPAGSRLSVRALGAALVSVGEIDINIQG